MPTPILHHAPLVRIVCPGPALDLERLELEVEASPGVPLLAVNVAIALVPRADAWLALDPPTSKVLRVVWDDYLRMEPRPVHRMNGAYAIAWQRELAKASPEARRTVTRETPYLQRPLLPGDASIRDKRVRDMMSRTPRYTTFAALATAFEWYAPNVIEVRGATMGGDGYKLERASEAAHAGPKARGVGPAGRWEKERLAMARWCDALEGWGVEVRVFQD
jgi:hypothetical protein